MTCGAKQRSLGTGCGSWSSDQATSRAIVAVACLVAEVPTWRLCSAFLVESSLLVTRPRGQRGLCHMDARARCTGWCDVRVDVAPSAHNERSDGGLISEQDPE